jgi:hypothetical protein
MTPCRGGRPKSISDQMGFAAAVASYGRHR